MHTSNTAVFCSPYRSPHHSLPTQPYAPTDRPDWGGLLLGSAPIPKALKTLHLVQLACVSYLNWKSKGKEVGSPIRLTQGPRQERQHITHILPEVLGLGSERKGHGNRLKGEGPQRGRRSQGGMKKSEMNEEWGHARQIWEDGVMRKRSEQGIGSPPLSEGGVEKQEPPPRLWP